MMRISGFSFVRNAVRLSYPVKEAVRSALSLVDEFVIVCGDSDDGTTEFMRSIGDRKIRIIETVWNPDRCIRGRINADQTNIALDACTGDWCVYLQADEVLHEKDLHALKEAMERYLHRPDIEGFLFRYIHFFGSYDRCQTAHNWYGREVRIVRNGIGVRSWKDAQGFRIGGRKLRVLPVDADIYHYGWARPPVLMTRKQIALSSLYHERSWVDERYPDPDAAFDYGSLKTCRPFMGTHPAVMRERISAMDWTVAPGKPNPKDHRHDRLSIRILSFIENRVLGRKIGEYRNYRIVRDPLGERKVAK